MDFSLEQSGGDAHDLMGMGFGLPTESERSLMERVIQELKIELKQGFRSRIEDMRKEILRKKRAGKIPGDTTIVLKNWSQQHSKCTYPTLADSVFKLVVAVFKVGIEFLIFCELDQEHHLQSCGFEEGLQNTVFRSLKGYMEDVESVASDEESIASDKESVTLDVESDAIYMESVVTDMESVATDVEFVGIHQTSLAGGLICSNSYSVCCNINNSINFKETINKKHQQ
ncbi:Homeobox protein knotted-1-like 3 [Capsicum chinense]|nr:Homeobox protein knotted-1-like 3 [Capsicum chinense]